MDQILKKDSFTAVETKAAIEAMFKAASLGIIISNEQGVIEHVNPYTNRLFGYKGEELIGQKIEY